MLDVTLAGISFPSPLLNASGCFNPSVFNEITPLKQCLGGIVTKTVTQNPLAGNPQPRTVELPGIGMLNSIGLQNPGLDDFLDQEILALKDYGLPVILSISACGIDEFGQMAAQITGHPNGIHVSALEVNLSCPNIAKGGVDFGNSPETVRLAIETTLSEFPRPVFAKLTPNVTHIVPIAAAAIEGGAQGITAINTVLGCAIDVKRRRPILPRISGGYSGPGIKPVALHAIWQIHHHFPEVPILGVGGISSAQDVLEFLMAGASMVQVGTRCFRSPTIFTRLRDELTDYMQSEGISHVGSLTGCAHERRILLK